MQDLPQPSNSSIRSNSSGTGPREARVLDCTSVASTSSSHASMSKLQGSGTPLHLQSKALLSDETSNASGLPPLHEQIVGSRGSSSVGIGMSPRPASASASLQSDEFSVDRLKFGDVGLLGREEEVKVIRDCLDKVSSKKRRQLLLLHGPSGCGKTSLANYATAQNEIHQDAVVASGKFDLYLRDEPYAGIIDALDEVMMGLMMQESQEHQPLQEQPQTALASVNKTPKIHEQVLAELGSTEVELLANLIPSLAQFLHETTNNATANNAPSNGTAGPPAQISYYKGTSSLSMESKSNQLHYAFRKFIRLLSRHHSSPLVLLLDDLQWADVQSLELLHLLLTDRENQDGLMILGLYRDIEHLGLLEDDSFGSIQRDNMRNDVSILKKTIQALHDIRDQDDNFHMREVALGNLSLDVVNQVVMRLLSADDADHTKGLAELCHRRTHGNAQYVVAFMTMLHDENLLSCELGTRRWRWDEAEIQKETAVAENVVEMLTKKINKSSGEVVQFLQIASCIGSEFDSYILQVVWNHISVQQKLKENEAKERALSDINASSREKEEARPAHLLTTNDIKDDVHFSTKFNRLLHEAVKSNYLDEVGPSRYHWVHDSIQEAAVSLIPLEELPSFKFSIGMVLMETLEAPNLDKNIFVIANLVNVKHDMIKTPTEKNVTLAELNLQAATKAKECSAFASAARYAGVGIRHLPVDKWENHFDLSLELYSTGAEVCGTRGETATMDLYANEITAQPSCTMVDKLRAYKTLLDSRCSEGRSQEALELCLKVLKNLGCAFPYGLRRIGRVISTISQLKKTLPPTEEDIRRLPMMTDPTRIECMRFMKMLGQICMLTKGNDLLFLLSLTRHTRWTLRYGLDVTSPAALVGFGMVVVGVLGDYEMASHYANHAICILDRLPEAAIAPALYSAHFLVLPWKNPLHCSLDPLRDGFEAGMRVGDSDSACYCLVMEVVTLLCAGKSLRAVLNVSCQVGMRTFCALGCFSPCISKAHIFPFLQLYVPQMEELKRTEVADMTRLVWQAAQNLMDYADDPLTLRGDAADEEVILESYLGKKKSQIPMLISLYKNYMYAYMGEYELGTKLAIQRGDAYMNSAPGSLLGMWDIFTRGICLYAVARTTRKRKFMKEADRARKMIRSWSEKGNPNVNHHLLLLNAEHAALIGNVRQARTLYEKAIVTATNGGFTPDVALANERYADYLGDSDQEAAGFCVREAVRFYDEWGASYNVTRLRESHPDLFDMTVPASSGIFASSTISSIGADASLRP